MWLLLAAFLVAAASGALWLLRQELFHSNPHFTLKQIDIKVHGNTPSQRIERKLEEENIQRGQTNLFEIDLGDLHRQIETWGSVPSKQLMLRKKLPDTLKITVFEREPIAQLRNRDGPFIDLEGILLPPQEGHDRQNIPLITPVRPRSIPEYGERIEHKNLEAALHTLQIISRYREYSELMDVKIIQLEHPSPRKMMLILNNQGTFVSNAQVVLPLSSAELPMALRRAVNIARDRLEARQMTGFIDASIRQNVPAHTRPKY